MDPTESKSFEVFADADFAGNWNPLTAQGDPSTAKYTGLPNTMGI